MLDSIVKNHRRYYLKACEAPHCTRSRYLQASDLNHAKCAQCQRLELAYTNAERWRNNPTLPEQAMMNLLDHELSHMAYLFQYVHVYCCEPRDRWFVFDFYFPAQRFVLEVNGWWHGTDEGIDRDLHLAHYCDEHGLSLFFVTPERLGKDPQGIVADLLKWGV